MSLRDPNWVTFSGEPITGRAPTRVTVFAPDASVRMNVGQELFVAARYREFCNAIRVSSFPDKFHMRRHRMQDGTEVVYQSIAGVHDVSVRLPGKKGLEAEVEITGGFLFVPKDGADMEGPEPWPITYMKTSDYVAKIRSEGRKSASTIVLPPALKKRTVVAQPKDFSIKVQRSAGPVSWCGNVSPEGAKPEQKHEVVLSYDHGLATRYRVDPEQNCSGGFVGAELSRAQSGRPGVYVFGQEVKTVFQEDEESDPITLNVVGAGVFDGRLVIVSHVDPFWEPVEGQDPEVGKVVADSFTVSVFIRAGGWKFVGKQNFGWQLKAPWFFSPDGSEAVSIKDMNVANQSRLRIALSFTDDPIEGRTYSAAFSDIALDNTAIYAYQVDIAEYESLPAEPAGWREPGEWQFASFGQFSGPGGSSFFTEGFDPGGIAASVSASAASVDPDVDWRVEAWRIDTFQNALDIDTPIWSRGNLVSGGWELYAIYGDFGNVFGSSNVTGYRTTLYTTPTGEVFRPCNRSAQGKRYVAADYNFAGQLQLLTLELIADGDPRFRPYGKYENGIENTFTGYTSNAPAVPIIVTPSSTTTGYEKSTTGWSLQGQIRWTYKINGAVIEEARGGVLEGVMTAEAELERRTADVPGGYEFELASYTAPTGRLVSERIYLLDADLRSRSAVLQKISVEFQATGIVADVDPVTFYSLVPHRLNISASEGKAHLVVVHKGQKVVDAEYSMPTYSGGAQLLRPVGAHMFAAPRAFEPKNEPEAGALLNYTVFAYEDAIYEVYRYWGFPAFGDPNPLTLQAGTLQTRDEEDTLFCVSNDITRNSSIYGVGLVVNHAREFHKGFFRKGASSPIDAALSQALSDYASRLPTQDEDRDRTAGPNLTIHDIKAT
jgi:hypothetical protein